MPTKSIWISRLLAGVLPVKPMTSSRLCGALVGVGLVATSTFPN
ncbi:MAG TPA: hypothetical protein VGK08_00260 [Thermoanaerobaculia bacterium]